MNLQEFNLRLVKLSYPDDIKDYHLREVGQLTSTPKIYIKSYNQQYASIYIQKLGECFSPLTWKNYNETVILDKLEIIITTIIKLRNKYGPFKIYQNLIKLDSSQSPKVWIHDDPTLNFRQYPLILQPNTQSLMIIALAKMFLPLIKQFNNFIFPETLQSFHSEIQRLNQSLKISKRASIERMFYSQRKSIKSFMENTIVKPNSATYNKMSDDIHFYDPCNSTKNINCSYDIKASLQTSFQHPAKLSYNHTPRKTRQSKNKSINFTYYNPLPLSRGSYQQIKYTTLSPILQYNEPEVKQKKNLKNEPSSHQFQIKEKDFTKPKFPHSTQSTLVTLKDTKSFKDMNFDLPIQQEQKSQSNNKGSSKGKSVGESRCDIEIDFENLFDREKQIENNQQQFNLRQQQFQEILFS